MSWQRRNRAIQIESICHEFPSFAFFRFWAGAVLQSARMKRSRRAADAEGGDGEGADADADAAEGESK